MIEVKNLTYTYPKREVPAVNSITFSIGRGEIFGFLGPSGAGKSTTQKILIGILKGYSGSVSFGGEVNLHKRSRFYESIGVAFEFPNFYQKFTALENLNFFSSLYNRECDPAEMWLERVGLREHRNVRLAQFSKGMKMRLNLCRALITRPDIIFLDEPQSGLDPTNARIVRDIITEKREEGKTIFLSTHNMHVAEELCNRVAFIVDGTIRSIDSPKALKLSQGERQITVEFREKGALLKREFPLKGIGTNSHFLKVLKEAQVETIHTMEPTLEDIFIKITGHTLSSGDANEAADSCD